MKTLILFAVTFCFLFLHCSPDYRAQKYLGLKGNVKNITDTVYFCSSASFVFDSSANISEITIIDFDTLGNVIQSIKYGGTDLRPSYTEQCSYREDTLVLLISKFYTGGDSFPLSKEYISVRNGVIKYRVTNDSQTWEEEVKTSGKYRCHFSQGDDWGTSKEEIWADENNNIIKFKLSEEIEWINSDSLEQSMIKHWIDEYKYDQDNKKIEMIRHWTQEYKYNQDDNGVAIIQDDDNVTTISCYTYTRYDDFGNWIEREIKKTDKHDNSSKYYRTKRTIEYYPKDL